MHAIDLIRVRSALIAVNQTSGELLKQLNAQAPTPADTTGPLVRAVADCQAALKIVGDTLMIEEPSPRLPDTLDTTQGHPGMKIAEVIAAEKAP